MLDFDKSLMHFYEDCVSKEIYKSKFPSMQGFVNNKIVLLNKVNKFTFWFPANSGRKSLEFPDKLKLRSRITSHSIYNFDNFVFLPTLLLFLNLKSNRDISSFVLSGEFNNYLILLNEVARKQENKRHTPPTKNRVVMSWKYRQYNNYSNLRYYFSYEPHRIVARIRKINFLSLRSWFYQPQNWVFTYKNMHTYFLRWRKIQKFEHKFSKFRGMSFRFWAKQQLQYNYLNNLSSDYLTDSYSSNFFIASQFSISNFEFNLLLGGRDQRVFF